MLRRYTAIALDPKVSPSAGADSAANRPRLVDPGVARLQAAVAGAASPGRNRRRRKSIQTPEAGSRCDRFV